MPGVFVTGTDTGVGKTVVSAWLVRALEADYWKPVQAGLEAETDTEAVLRLTGLGRERVHPEAYRLSSPMAPHQAAERDGVAITLDAIRLPEAPRPLVVEGVGGVLVPLNGSDLVTDLMARLGLPVVVVARSGLGTINHTLLTLEALRARRLPVLGVVLDGPRHPENRAAVEGFGRVRVLSEFPVLDPVDEATVETAVREVATGFTAADLDG